MENPIKYLLRRRLYRKKASPVPTGLIPWSQISTAVVFVESNSLDYEQTVAHVWTYFEKKGIKCCIVSTTMDSVNWLGHIKPKVQKTWSINDGSEDLFISLLPGNSYAVKFAAIKSHARLKIGREQIKKEVFDIIVTDVDDTPASQVVAFREMVKWIDKIVA